MAILKETNMWFILIVVFAYMTPLGFSGNVEQVCSADLLHGSSLGCWGLTGGSVHADCRQNPETCSTVCGEPLSSLGVDFAFCISL